MLDEAPGAVTKWTVNVGPRTAEAVNWLTRVEGVTPTEALRRLVAFGYMVSREVRDHDVDVLLRNGNTTRQVLIPFSDGEV